MHCFSVNRLKFIYDIGPLQNSLLKCIYGLQYLNTKINFIILKQLLLVLKALALSLNDLTFFLQFSEAGFRQWSLGSWTSPIWWTTCFTAVCCQGKFLFGLSQTVWPDFGIKVAQILPKSCPKSGTIFTLKLMLFKIAPKVTKYLGYFCNNICYLELSKIVQSHHTGLTRKILATISKGRLCIRLLNFFTFLAFHRTGQLTPDRLSLTDIIYYNVLYGSWIFN